MAFGQNIRNFFFPANPSATTNAQALRTKSALNPSGYISPVQFNRLKVDIQGWRDAVSEAEQAYYPHRVKMQRIAQDTVLNGQVTAVMNAMKDLTLLKDFEVTNGTDVDKNATELITKQWFKLLVNYILDAQFFGYSLVGLGDIVDNAFPKVQLVKRWNVSPDRHTLNTFVYSMSGIDFMNPESKDDNGNSFCDWTVYVDTPTETGGSICGYGMLYKLAYYEILIRNNVGYNATYLELFGQPIRVGSTSKQDEYERAVFAQAMRDMGTNAWMVKDTMDEVELLESNGGGKGQQGFADFEARMLKMVNKIVLGHADAIDSQTGKLGGQTEVQEAINKKEKLYNSWTQDVLNSTVVPKLMNLGFPIKPGYYISIVNNREKEEKRTKEDASNKITAEIAQTMKNGGLKMDAKYFTERTGIPAVEIEEADPIPTGLNPVVKQKIKALYEK